MAQLAYWVADWNLSEGEAAMQLGGDVDYMVDTISAYAKPDLSFLERSEIRKIAVYVTGPADVVWSAGEVAAYRLAGFTVVTIDQRDGPAVLANVGDVESGGKTQSQAIVEAEDVLDRGGTYTIYLDRANLSYFEAAWATTRRPPGKVVAIQWASPTSNPDTVIAGDVTLREANCDLSVTVPDWHPIGKAATTRPAPATEKRAVVQYDRVTDGWAVHPGVDKDLPPGDYATVTFDEAAGPGWSIKPGIAG